MTTHYMTATATKSFPEESTEQKIRRWITEAFVANAADSQGVTWEWNNDFTARLGDANGHNGLIRLSTPLWARATEQEREQVVKHEACHLVVRQRYGWEVRSHGPEWKEAMRRCGLQPDRCHNVERGDLVKRQPRYAVTCSCGANKSFAPIRYRRLLAGVGYVCNKCGSRITKV